jgi:hypothetical protein
MLLKFLFTLLAILWLIQALKPYFQIQAPPDPKSFPPTNPNLRYKQGGNPSEEDGEYIDYEEIK